MALPGEKAPCALRHLGPRRDALPRLLTWALALTDETPDADSKASLERLSRLREEHRDLDVAIDALVAAGTHNQIQIQRLKKRKLQLKDQIRVLEDGQLPNIIA
jgi:hypothetical protein